jgi:hypothetical protein|tara:strand:+ start:152 stop:433 length:282 start_codon:yes stop_codon:yes gene_type:complete
MAREKVFDGTLNKYVEIEVDNQENPNDLSNKKKNKRNKRNMLLNQSDWTMTSDSPLTDSQKDEAKTYRQSLRDLPAHNEFPNNTFPTKPNFIK